LASRAVLQVAQDTLAARQLTLKQVTALAQSSLQSSLDVSFADVNVSEAELALFRAENDIRAAITELTAAMGLTTERAIRLQEEPMPDVLPDSNEALIAAALKNRPDLASLRLQHEASLQLARGERRLWLPTLSLIGAAGVLPERETKLEGRYSGVGINVSVPILNGGLFSARKAEADARAQSAGQEVKSMEVRITRDVKIAWLNAENAHRRLGVTARWLEQASTALRLAQSRYNLGLSSIVELTQAQLIKTTAEIASANARYDYQQARAALDYETGALR